MLAAIQKEQDLPQSGQQKQDKRIWLRQEGESILWFNRFTTYRKLGPKRSLRAAVQALQEYQIVPKSTEYKPFTVIKSDDVPGSWKAASVKWRWVERAQAWDEHIIDAVVEVTIEEATQGLAVSINRIHALETMGEKIRAILNNPDNHLTPEELDRYMARLQSLIKDIRDEMRHFDRKAVRSALFYKAGKDHRDGKLVKQ